MNIIILGLSITSAWGNGHATTYRALVKALSARGHRVSFLERDVPWYAQNRDLPEPPFCTVHLYQELEELKARHGAAVHAADLVMLGSCVPEGIAVGRWLTRVAAGVTAFYDIDTPVTLANLARNECEYLNLRLIPEFDLYLSFTGGPVLERLESEFGARRARPLYCAVDPELYHPEHCGKDRDLSYMGTYSPDRQPPLESLLLEPARRWPGGRFTVAGPQYPENIDWPANVHRIEHLPPHAHCRFYNRSRYTLNLTRADMTHAGYSPSVRLFEAAACGAPIISDPWEGLETFFTPSEEILIAHTPREVLRILRELPENAREMISANARARILASHTATHRATELERYVEEARSSSEAGMRRASA